ncbi:MAG: hypothetical protein HYZ58_06735, partial [Acidobacteria bacterium]|nr:hypothetical protein [Acidobacteriota bacterium]
MHDRHQVIHLANPPEAAPVDATTVEQAKQRLKEQKRMDATRPLDSWERYRALNDAM